jgi:hypothetical protein
VKKVGIVSALLVVATVPPSIARASPSEGAAATDGAPSDLRGMVAGVDAAFRLTHYLSLAPSYELSLYDARSDRVQQGPTATSHAAFLEARLDTNPDGPLSVRIDLGPGYRWLALPLASGTTDRYSGVEPLRMHVGPSYRVAGSVELAVLGGFGFGWFVARPGAQACAVTAACPDSAFDSTTQSSAHFVLDLSLAIRGLL